MPGTGCASCIVGAAPSTRKHSLTCRSAQPQAQDDLPRFQTLVFLLVVPKRRPAKPNTDYDFINTYEAPQYTMMTSVLW